MFQFTNSYHALGNAFYQTEQPNQVSAPKLLLWNQGLADDLACSGISELSPESLAEIFSGNQALPGSKPITMAYAGHQFGNFVPQLGDGRAHLLGCITTQDGNEIDLQLKGSGATFFSRGGDGRCAIGPAVREFLMSEAMHALGIPTTRCLAVVKTGEPVYRQQMHPGAVVTRTASSHIRVGTFQYFAAREDLQSLKTLADYTIQRHYPDISVDSSDPYVQLLDHVLEKQIQLVVSWMRVGFIHGVMNTDNTAISGETLDYGPCAMMGAYSPKTVYSSIDRMGRYAFGNQPIIAQWNLARFTECLLPLIHPKLSNAIDAIEPLILGFQERFQNQYWQMIGRKLGFLETSSQQHAFLEAFLKALETHKKDYTQTFDRLTRSFDTPSVVDELQQELQEHYIVWQQHLKEQELSNQEAQSLMRQHNPVVIPRNHHVEAVLEDCERTGGPEAVEAFLEVLRQPYTTLPNTKNYQDLSQDGDQYYRTFCGT